MLNSGSLYVLICRAKSLDNGRNSVCAETETGNLFSAFLKGVATFGLKAAGEHRIEKHIRVEMREQKVVRLFAEVPRRVFLEGSKHNLHFCRQDFQNGL